MAEETSEVDQSPSSSADLFLISPHSSPNSSLRARHSGYGVSPISPQTALRKSRLWICVLASGYASISAHTG